MNIFITGGAGFIGSHVARYYLKKGHNVTIYDNLCRSKLLKNKNQADYNWNDLGRYNKCARIKGDIKNFKKLKEAMKYCDTVFHLAAQTAVTTSMDDPRIDFNTNALGTFNVLEAARFNKVKSFIYASTNKVYGDNVNTLMKIKETPKRWKFTRSHSFGVPESFSIDHCEHSPYGCSKLAGDMYVQDYGKLYDMKVGVFRMSCLAEGTIIPTVLGNKKIEDVIEGDMVYSYDEKNNQQKICRVKKAFQTDNTGKILYKIKTQRGKIIEATGDHLFYTPQGYKKVEDLSFGSFLMVSPMNYNLDLPIHGSPKTIVDEDSFNKEIRNLNFVRGHLYDVKANQLRRKGLLPLKYDSSNLLLLTELVGYCFGDANFSILKKKNRQSKQLQLQIYGKKKDLERISLVLGHLGIDHGSVKTRYLESRLTNGHVIAGDCCVIRINDSAFLTLFKLLGVPLGDKPLVEFDVPAWIKKGNMSVRRAFLRGLFGAELCRLKYSEDKKYFGGHSFYQSKSTTLLSSMKTYMSSIKEMLLQFGINTTPINKAGTYNRVTGIETTGLVFKIKSANDNLIKFSKIGFSYVDDREQQLGEFLEFNNEPTKPQSYHDWHTFYETGVEGSGFMWDVIKSIKKVPMKPIYDLTIEGPPNFVANGFLVHNCIYGTHQFGVEDQGWIAWFTIATLLKKPITIYGDGKQVRDILYVDDLIRAYDLFLKSDIKSGVYNIGGGKFNTISLHELVDALEERTGEINKIKYSDWRPADQEVYISNITKINQDLGWMPKIHFEEGLSNLISWVKKNKGIFK